jgi:hypothetical protein
MLLLTGTISNQGGKPLVPAYFDLNLGVNGEWIEFHKMLIPTDLNFDNGSIVVDFDNHPSKMDLQKYQGVVSVDMPIHGYLMFVSDQVELEALGKDDHPAMRIICVDVFGRRHATDVALGERDDKTHLSFPKHGLTVKSNIED